MSMNEDRKLMLQLQMPTLEIVQISIFPVYLRRLLDIGKLPSVIPKLACSLRALQGSQLFTTNVFKFLYIR